ncbi:tetratricopeptide repeat protein [Sessilibacter corallicola]|uniref:Tetratricopeptide repeat protein n=1 Tax=Sessilibacter corallicola TaxID=2904075 RepID=A0ABQ0ADB8_9GAMM
MSRVVAILLFTFLTFSPFSSAQDETESDVRQTVDTLEEPLYSPFIERYMLDELKQLRIDQEKTKQELIQQIVDREHKSVDRAVAYATDTVTYFFYLIAAATSVLVLVGWTSIRDIKERVHTIAEEEISKIIRQSEKRLAEIETVLKQETQNIQENRDEIERTQEVQSLWLRAQRESSFASKIEIYDEILKLRHNDCDALTYKADAVLELNEPNWAVNLCHQVLKIDPDNSHAFYQLACAYTVLEQYDEALRYIAEAIKRRDSYLDDIRTDPALEPLVTNEVFQELSNLIAGSSEESNG